MLDVGANNETLTRIHNRLARHGSVVLLFLPGKRLELEPPRERRPRRAKQRPCPDCGEALAIRRRYCAPCRQRRRAASLREAQRRQRREAGRVNS